MKFSLQFKLLAFLFVFIVGIFCFQTIFLNKIQDRIIEIAYEEKTKTLIQALNIAIGPIFNLENQEKIFSAIQKILSFEPTIIEINIIAPPSQEAKIIVSNIPELINKKVTLEDFNIPKENKDFLKLKIVKESKEKFLLVFAPIISKGEVIGLYNLKISIESVENILNFSKIHLITLSTFLALTLFFTFYGFVKKEILNPIFEIRKSLIEIGKGKFELEMKVKKEDEIGDLSERVIKTAKELQALYRNLEDKVKERTKELEEKIKELEITKKELEESKALLEIKVKERTEQLKELASNLEGEVKKRTKELEERLKELEKFHRLTIGREMKMLELKKENEKLKEELKKYKMEKGNSVKS